MKRSYVQVLCYGALAGLVALAVAGCDNGFDEEYLASAAKGVDIEISDSGGEIDQPVDDEAEGDSLEESAVAVCHLSPIDPSVVYTIYVAPSRVDALLAEGDALGTCDEVGDEVALVAICHESERSPGRLLTIYVDPDAVDGYLDYGDTLGACAEPVDEELPGGGDLIAICHFPPEDPFAMLTIYVEVDLIDSYLDAGDILGSCEDLWL